MAGLATIGQEDFAAGIVRATARHLIPPAGAYDLLNLLLDDDGSLYRRGGSVYLPAASIFRTAQLRHLLDVRLTAGRRTLVATTTAYAALLTDDSAFVNLGGAGLPAPTGAAVLGGALFIAGGVVYGGSLKAADYSTGTVSVTNGSATVTGVGTSWSANVDAGMLLRVAGGEVHVVASVNSNTNITLDRPFQGATAAGQAYTLKRLDAPAVSAPVYAAGGDRLITCSGNVIHPSMGADPNTGALRYGTFDPTDTMQLPDGAEILGAAMVRDLLLVFTTEGVFAVTNIALELTNDFGNLQRHVDKLTGDVVLWGQAGIASWGNALVVPTIDGVALMDGASGPTLVAQSIAPMISAYVRDGYQPGGAVVHRNHYFLPVLDAVGDVIDLLVCRLDRPTRSRLGTIFPWTRVNGHGGNVTALAQRVGGVAGARQPQLLAAGAAGRALDLSRFFTPDSDVKNDADGTTHELQIDTRDFATGGGNLNTVRQLRVRYELVDAGGDDPVLLGYYSIGVAKPGTPYWGAVTWGAFTWTDPSSAEFVALSGTAPESTGRDPFTWLFASSTRYIRGRLKCTLPAARCTIRSVEWAILQSAKDR